MEWERFLGLPELPELPELPTHLQNITNEHLMFGSAIVLAIFYIIYIGRGARFKLGLLYLKYKFNEFAYKPVFDNFYKKEPRIEEPEEFIYEDIDPNSNLDDGEKAKKILDDIMDSKFEYYMYKEILPLYLGNQKKAPVTNEKFKELKNTFYQDVKLSISPVLIRRLNYIFTPSGVGIYIHSRFSTMFNKTDAKFVNKDNTLDKDNFFMSGGTK